MTSRSKFPNLGVVKSYDLRKGYGFLIPVDGSKEVYFHHSAIGDVLTQLKLTSGSLVKFRRNRNFKNHAKKVEPFQMEGFSWSNQPSYFMSCRAFLDKEESASTYISKGYRVLIVDNKLKIRAILGAATKAPTWYDKVANWFRISQWIDR